MIAIQIMITEESYAMAINNGPANLRDAKRSHNWLEWENVIQVELEQHRTIGTWSLVIKPWDAIPITNKWVFVRKTNKLGDITENKARLVIKGCLQQPRFDFNETYAPVVRIETVRLLLAMVPRLDLRVQQMDIKGAYLNGILKETIYMRQPEGYSDGTDRVCKLNRTLYGLKQAGREWNQQLDLRLQSLQFK